MKLISQLNGIRHYTTSNSPEIIASLWAYAPEEKFGAGEFVRCGQLCYRTMLSLPPCCLNLKDILGDHHSWLVLHILLFFD